MKTVRTSMHLWTKALACLVLATGIPHGAWSQDWNALGPDDHNLPSQGWAEELAMAANGSDRVVIAFEDFCNSEDLTVMERGLGGDWQPIGAPGFAPNPVDISIALDGSGDPVVAFGNGTGLQVYRWDGASWMDMMPLATGNVFSTSLALDASGNPYVAYRDFDNGNKATVMHFDGFSWSLVGSAGFSTGSIFGGIDLAINGSGFPVVAYRDDVVFGGVVQEWNGTSWNSFGTSMLTPVQGPISLALDASDHPVVAYRGSSPANRAYAQRWNGTSWEQMGFPIANLSIGQATHIDIIMNASDTPVVTFKDDGASSKTRVMIWDELDTEWDQLGSDVGSGATAYTVLAKDGIGTIFLAHTELDIFGKAMVWQFDGANWIRVGDPGISEGMAGYPSMTLDESGLPVVVYRDENAGGKATVKRWNGSSWDIVGTAGISVGAIDHPDIAVDPAGVIYIAYSDQSSSFNITVQRFNGTWSVLGTPDFADGLTNYISMDLDGSGNPVVSYRDYAHGNGVTVERWNGSTWLEVGAKGFSGGLANYTSIVMDPSDNPVVSFIDATAGNKVSVMEWDGISAWNHVGGTAGIHTGTAEHTSMRMDGSGNIYVAFRHISEGPAGRVSVMKWDGSSWSFVGPPGFSAGFAAYHPSLALDPLGEPVVAFRGHSWDRKASAMQWDGSSWNLLGSLYETAAFNDEEPTSWLEIDDAGRMTIAYASGYMYAKQYADIACTDWTLTIRTDGSGGDISYEVIEDGTSAILASGGGFADNALYTLPVCIPDNACFHLVVNDAGGDGIAAPGGWMLQDPFGKRVIDNLENGAGSWATAQVGRPVCDPVGTVQLIASDCDREDFLRTEFIACSPDPAVSAEWGIGDNSDDGYQFWIFDPVSGFNRKIFRPHNSSGGFGPPTATRACHLRLASMVSVAPPDDVLLNVRVRPCVNGVYGDYGPACRMKIVGTPVSCPTTTLYDLPYEPAKLSCGVTGKVTGGSDKLWLIPIPGATTYKWRFEYPMEGFARNINTTNAALVLGTWYTTPLLCGTYTYDVKISASFDGGITWCDFGDACEVEITNTDPMHCTPAGAPSVRSSIAEASEPALTIWPNPGTGDHLSLQVSGLAGAGGQVQIDLFGPAGRLLKQWTLSTNELMTGHELPLDNELASGPYVVHVRDGEHSFTQRWIIE